MSLLKASDLHLWRGDRHVLRGLSFDVPAGRCLQVQGANGSGKTSLLRALCGLLPLESGSIEWSGHSVRQDWLAYCGTLAWAGHHGGLKGDLSPLENLCSLARVSTRTPDAEVESRARESLQRTALPDDCLRRPVRQLSAGQQRRVTLARVLLQQRPLWLLDEPVSNLDAEGQALVSELLRAHLCGGGLAVVATHQPLLLAEGQCLPLALHT
jgi:heme exporter protein A